LFEHDLSEAGTTFPDHAVACDEHPIPIDETKKNTRGENAGADSPDDIMVGLMQASGAVMTGEVAAFFDTPITALPQIRAGTVRAVGVSTSKRLAVAPEIPTIAEAGVANYEVTGWNGVLAPANTPRRSSTAQQDHRGGA